MLNGKRDYFYNVKSIDYRVALMLGGNLGDTRRYLSEAIRLLAERIGKIERLSGIYLSQPWGLDNQPTFQNQAIVVISKLTPIEILENTKIIEGELGRIRRELNGPREIDIDILLFEEFAISEKDLEIPHPRLHLRNFNLVPLAEIAPDWVHPVFNRTISSLLEDCPDTLPVQKIT